MLKLAHQHNVFFIYTALWKLYKDLLNKIYIIIILSENIKPFFLLTFYRVTQVWFFLNNN